MYVSVRVSAHKAEGCAMRGSHLIAHKACVCKYKYVFVCLNVCLLMRQEV